MLTLRKEPVHRKAPGRYSFFRDQDGKVVLIQHALAYHKPIRFRNGVATVLLTYLFMVVILGKILTFWFLYLMIPAVFVWTKCRWDSHWLTRKRIFQASLLWGLLLFGTLCFCLVS